MHRIIHMLAACAIAAASLISLSSVAHAETHITDGYLYDNAVWTARDGPYIVEDPVTVLPDHSLTIEAGTTVIASSSIEGYSLFYIQGQLNLNGTKDARISVSGPGQMSVRGGTTTISNTDISIDDGISVAPGAVYISSSTISGARQAIHVRSGQVSVVGSTIKDNDYGIFVEPSVSPPIFQVRQLDSSSGSPYGVGGIGNALDPAQSEIVVSDSHLLNNTEAAIQNGDTSMVHAADNWWGSDTGPLFAGPNKIVGSVEYAPWRSDKPTPTCCSSILFLPGLEGSRLYRPEQLPLGAGVTTNRLWEPNRNADVQKLYLAANGSSTDASIYSGGPIDKVFGVFDIYGKFMTFLDGLVGNGTIGEWKAFGYDWRKPIAEVVAGSEKKATTTESLVQTVEDLAARSKTGKVTLIAHSNGGLVAKYLVKTLTDIGKESLIDSVISVAVPYLGTPEAIGGLLHGDDQVMGWGIIASAASARGLGKNMPSAYTLLPSREYFSHIFTPAIAFASTTIPGLNEGSYPQTVSTYADEANFIADSGNARATSTYDDTSLPQKGNQTLLMAADVLHGILDPFSWPASIARWAIVGYGAPTTQGLNYSLGRFCLGSLLGISCGQEIVHSASTTLTGDGTVVAPSAAYNAGTPVSVDLRAASQADGTHLSHGNILEASATESIIGAIVRHDGPSNDSATLQEITHVPGVSVGEPDYSKSSFLVVRTHSPVELHIYDAQGHHTGPIAAPSGTDEPIESGLYSFYETKVPGSDYKATPAADGGIDTQIFLPDDNGEKYSVTVKGTDFGFVGFDVEQFTGGQSLGKATYTMEPVTPLMVATTTVGGALQNGSYIPVASTTPSLHVDEDGDGTPDFEAVPGSGLPGNATSSDDLVAMNSEASRVMSIALKKVSAKLAPEARRKLIWLKLDLLLDALRNRRLSTMNQSALTPMHFGHFDLKNLPADQKSRILDFIEKMAAQN